MTARHFGLRPVEREEERHFSCAAAAASAAASLVAIAFAVAIVFGLGTAFYGPPAAVVRLFAWP